MSLPAAWNYLDTMARWRESYHLSQEEGCDTYARKSFLDHFFGPNTDIESFDDMKYVERSGPPPVDMKAASKTWKA